MTIQFLPKTVYNFSIENESPLPIILPDVLVRFNFEFLASEQRQALFDYYILDGETPEIISDKFYGTTDYHWLIMYINNKFDYISDFPIKEEAIYRHTQDKYGDDQVEAIHHYEDDKGNICNEYYYDYTNKYGAQPTGTLATEPIWKQESVYDTSSPIPLQNAPAFVITNLEYETRLNDEKRYIVLIKDQYITQFYKSYIAALNNI
jgi:hypothetical protein